MNGIVKSLATVSGLTIASRVLGFIRQVIIAGVIGAGGSPVADAFWAAFRLPNMFRRLFAEGAFHAAFIPLFQGRRADGGEAAARAFAEETLAALVFILTLLTATVELFAPVFVTGLVSGFREDPEKFALTTFYARIMFPYLAMMSVVGLLSGILNSLGRFAAAAAAPVLLNICMIVGLLAFANSDPAQVGAALSWSVFVGGFAQLGLLAFGAARLGWGPRLRIPRFTKDVRRLAMLGAPGFIAAGAVQINLIIGTNIASREPGAVSWLMNADQLYQLPLAVIGIALGVVLLPLLADRVKSGDEAGAATALERAVIVAAIFSFPAAAAFMTMGSVICDALFRSLAGDALKLAGAAGSAFTLNDAEQTGLALAWFGAGLPAFVWQKVYSPAFFAREDTATPMRFALVSIAFNTVLALILFPRMGFVSVALATSLAAWLQLSLLARAHYKRRGVGVSQNLKTSLLRVLVASACLGLFLKLTLQYQDELTAIAFDRVWILTIGLVLAGVIIYAALLAVVGVAKLSDYKALLASR
ncbi:MAG: murein biosynthesis integral membrane protein MurJ [Pseudomonadota bacterium]